MRAAQALLHRQIHHSESDAHKHYRQEQHDGMRSSKILNFDIALRTSHYNPNLVKFEL